MNWIVVIFVSHGTVVTGTYRFVNWFYKMKTKSQQQINDKYVDE